MGEAERKEEVRSHSSPKLDITSYPKCEDTLGDCPGDDVLLHKQAEDAKVFISNFNWSTTIVNCYFLGGTGGVIAVFALEFNPPINDQDKYLLVFTGDIPAAYIVLDDICSPEDALETYCSLLEEWVEAVLKGHSLEGVVPIDAPATVENAEAFSSRLKFIRANASSLLNRAI